MKALVTGCAGFIGSHLAEFLLDQGLEVTGTFHLDKRNVEPLGNRVRWRPCEVVSRESVESLIDDAYDLVFHLAAQSTVLPSWADPEMTFRANVLGTTYLLEAIRESGRSPIILVAGSAAEYGLTHEDELPTPEGREFRPFSPYAVSKIGQDMLGYLYQQAFGLPVVRFRLFNTVGPRKRNDACSDFARRIAEIEAGRRERLVTGNLSGIRDFTDVLDTVRAIWLLATRGTPGEVYNICSARGVAIREVVEQLVALAQAEIRVEVDPARFRPLDEPVCIGDNQRLRALGWAPRVPLEESLARILEFWRREIATAR